MPEYIDKQAVLNLIDDIDYDSEPTTWEDPFGSDKITLEDDALDKLRNAIKYISPADVAPVVHARWEYEEDGYDIRCSACGSRVPAWLEDWGYCPSCGARMDGEEDRKQVKEIVEEYSREPGAGGWDCSDEEYNYSGYVRDVINGEW